MNKVYIFIQIYTLLRIQSKEISPKLPTKGTSWYLQLFVNDIKKFQTQSTSSASKISNLARKHHQLL
jgi:hypothetical protein